MKLHKYFTYLITAFLLLSLTACARFAKKMSNVATEAEKETVQALLEDLEEPTQCNHCVNELEKDFEPTSV